MDQVEEIKSKVDIVQLIGEYVPLKRAGRNFKGLCPFHGEKTPSFMVNPELQIFKCFGCGKSGDAYSFLQFIEGMEFGEALSALAKRVGVTLVSYKPSQIEEVKERLIHINTLSADVYHYLLTQHRVGQPALAYVKGRGLTDETIGKFKLGYAPDSWDVLYKFLVAKKKLKLDDVQQAGLIVPGKRYDRFRDRLMFPINNHRGQTVGFTGRQLPWSATQGGKYVNSPDSEIFHKSEILYGLDLARSGIKAKGEAIVVEGQMDLIPSVQTGINNIVAIGGTALTTRQIELLRRLCDTVTMALDADFAGDSAARRGIELAEKAGLIIKIVNPSDKFKDPGEWATADVASWQQALQTAIPIYDFYLQSAVKRYGLDIIGKKKIAQELLPLWARIDDQIVAAHYIQELATTLGVSEDDVRAQLAKVATTSPTTPETKIEPDQDPDTGREGKEAYVVELALKGQRVKDLVRLPIHTPFWLKVVQHLARNSDIQVLPSEIKDRVQNLFLNENDYSDKDWAKAVSLLEKIDIQERVASSTPEEQVKLFKRKNELTKYS